MTKRPLGYPRHTNKNRAPGKGSDLRNATAQIRRIAAQADSNACVGIRFSQTPLGFGKYRPNHVSDGRPAQQPFNRQPTRVKIIPTRMVSMATSQNAGKLRWRMGNRGTETTSASGSPPYIM